MLRNALLIIVWVVASLAGPAALAQATPGLSIQPAPADPSQPLRLVGRHARQQLAVTAQLATEQVRDVTRSVTYAAEPAGVVQVDANGMVVPLADGTATVTAKAAD